MCMKKKFTLNSKKAWLKKQPETITAYKAVRIRDDPRKKDGKSIYPFYFGRCRPFERTNLLKKERTSGKKVITRFKTKAQGNTEYTAYYHLFADKKEAEAWFGYDRVIECKVPKKYVTDIGVQWSSTIIVTRQFTIVGQDQYLD